MFKHNSNEERKHEGDVAKGLPEAAPSAGNAYEEDDHPVQDAPDEHGEIPRTRDSSKDEKKDPWEDEGK